MKTRTHRKVSKGQSLVEFALVLPVLLLIVMGTIDFSYILFVYINLSNATREGARYGIVNPWDYEGINAEVRDTILVAPPDQVDIAVWYDTGPNGEVFVDPQRVAMGNRIIVQTDYEVLPITPFIEPFIGKLNLSIKNSRTIQSTKLASGAPPPVAPTPTLAPGETPAPTETPMPPPTAIATPTEGPTPTPSPTPTPEPILIAKPVYDTDPGVQGVAEPNESIVLRVVQNGYEQAGTVDAYGNFMFYNVPLVAGYTVVVEGYGSQDLAVVQGAEPTATPTPAPTGPYIVLEPTCGESRLQQVIVHGYNWPADNSINKVDILWDGVTQGQISYKKDQSFSVSLSIFVEPGTHTVEAQGLLGGAVVVAASAEFTSPCPAEPTPTPTVPVYPDMVITDLSLQTTGELGTYRELMFNVDVTNQGLGDVSSLFWIELYLNPSADIALSEQESVDNVALNGLTAGTTTNFSMYLPDGVSTVGPHTLVAYVDSLERIIETDETNNTSAPVVITVTIANPEPTPTPTPEVPPGSLGAIEGQTYIDGIIQGNVTITVYDIDGNPVAEGKSDSNGNYLISSLIEGEYTVVGEMRMGDTLYRDQLGPVPVTAGETLIGVDLNLRKLITL
ncbi:MAG: pilus assembly protein [Anaerolineae bacterium]|nr:pilus assembly protein [Anaerolineae bacterium]